MIHWNSAHPTFRQNLTQHTVFWCHILRLLYYSPHVHADYVPFLACVMKSPELHPKDSHHCQHFMDLSIGQKHIGVFQLVMAEHPPVRWMVTISMGKSHDDRGVLTETILWVSNPCEFYHFPLCNSWKAPLFGIWFFKNTCCVPGRPENCSPALVGLLLWVYPIETFLAFRMNL